MYLRPWTWTNQSSVADNLASETDVVGSMDLMNGQASNVNIAATASEVRHLTSLVVRFLTWHSYFSSIMVGHRFKSELEKKDYKFLSFLKTVLIVPFACSLYILES